MSMQAPEWRVDSSGSIQSLSSQDFSSLALRLVDADIVEVISMWKNPDFLGRIFMQQADRLGFTEEEKIALFGSVTRDVMSQMVSFSLHNEGYAPSDQSKLGAVLLEKLPHTIESYEELRSSLLNAKGIIEIYPSRTDRVSHIYSVLHHEINHLCMMLLYIYRNEKEGVSIQETVDAMSSSFFHEVTETLAWLDGGQVPNFELLPPEYAEKYAGWNEGGRYDLSVDYDRAKLRSYRIHVLQLKIHNLSDTTSSMYQDWCRKIRDILFAGLRNAEYLTLLDEYLENRGNKGNRELRDTLLSIH